MSKPNEVDKYTWHFRPYLDVAQKLQLDKIYTYNSSDETVYVIPMKLTTTNRRRVRKKFLKVFPYTTEETSETVKEDTGECVHFEGHWYNKHSNENMSALAKNSHRNLRTVQALDAYRFKQRK